MDVADTANNTILCFRQLPTRSRGVFYGDNPFNYSGPLLLAQLSISAILTSALQSLITPLGETSFVAQTLVGLVLGPWVFGKASSARDLIFPADSLYVSETVSSFGLTLFLFLLGVKMDISTLRKSEKRAIVMGMCTFVIPLALNEALAALLLHSVTMNPVLHHSLLWIASFECLTSFHVISCLLHDLKLLNSELGRLAISASMISGICSYLWSLLLFTIGQSEISGRLNFALPMFSLMACLIAIIVYILRPVLLWIVRKTGEDKAVKETYIILVFLMVLGCSMLGELMGQHFLLGPVILGLAVPEGPPLGSALVAKMDSYISSILVPLYFVVTVAHIDFSSTSIRTFGLVGLLAFFGFVWKVMGIMVPSLYYKMSVKDAVSLGFIMSSQGIVEVLIIERATQLGVMRGLLPNSTHITRTLQHTNFLLKVLSLA